MLNIDFWMPTRVIVGEGCIKKHKEEFSSLGKKALLVTGKNSARISGAFDDVISALKAVNVEYLTFNEVEENPSLLTVARAGELSRNEKVDFIIGIGGGSPLDASKAVAALATNPIPAGELFTAKLENNLLPIVAIPTTAGTGSEVTQYSILTDHELETKRNFSNRETFPRVAFLDAKYTATLTQTVTINTAVDFLCHALEGYLSTRSNAMSDFIALEVFRKFKTNLSYLQKGEFPIEVRSKLLYASTLAGIVIAQTGTCMVHGLGYPLTYYGKIPHGRANGLLVSEFLGFNYEVAKEKIDTFLRILCLESIEEFERVIDSILGVKEKFTDEELRLFAKASLKSKSILRTPRIPTEKEIYDVFRNSLGES